MMGCLKQFDSFVFMGMDLDVSSPVTDEQFPEELP